LRHTFLSAVFVALGLLVTSPGPAAAAPPDRAAALAAWQSVQQDEQEPAGWTGSVDSCTIGTESAASLAATLHTVNALRDFAGVGPVSFDDALNHKALAAALMMLAKNKLSHTPGPDWPCYSDDGADAAGHSNLALGGSGADAMLLYAGDESVPSLGHRRWLLDPSKTVFGSGSTGGSNALYVITDGGTAVPAGTKVSWPPAGWVPRELVPSTWSLTVGGSSQTVEFQNPQVTVTLDGNPVSVDNVSDLDGGYGTGRTLAWHPTLGSSFDTGDHVVGVTVSGAVVDGQPLPVSYSVRVFDPAPPPLRFVSGPLIRRSDGSHGKIRKGVRLAVRTKVSGGAVTGYRWLRDGGGIKKATGRTYRVKGADRGHRLSCRVTATSAAGATLVRKAPSVFVSRH
jgi:uncharacterized protein YkwD